MDFIDEETYKELNSYKIQIVFSCLLILAILISISVIKDFYCQKIYGKTTQNIELTNRKSRIASLIFLITTLYLAFLAFETYRRGPSKTKLVFLIATELALIAAFMRYLTLVRVNVESIDNIF